MKTTVEIADALLDQARKVAERRGVTLRTLIEEGLRVAVKSATPRPRFRLRNASFAGQGLDPAFDGAEWQQLRDAAYKGRGA